MQQSRLSTFFVDNAKKRRRDSVDDAAVGRPQKCSKGDEDPDLNAISSDVSMHIIPLLDVTSLTSLSAISGRFDEIANVLFRDYNLLLTHGETQTKFEILELEFYLQKPGHHDDPFTHGSEEQRQSGRWYFHRLPKRFDDPYGIPGGYKSGSRKGLDLTFGKPASSTPSTSGRDLRGGILLRTLRRMSDLKVISGPSLLVDEILRLSGAASIPELVEEKWGGDISAWTSTSAPRPPMSTSLCLQRRTGSSPVVKPPIYRSPRIGLELSHPSTTDSLTHPRVIYVSKPYRYFIQPDLLVANGRAHTFLGVYRACCESGRFENNEGGLRREVVRLSKLSEKTAGRYLEDYKYGIEHGSLKSFIGSAGKGASASPSVCLKMFGTLARLQAAGGS